MHFSWLVVIFKEPEGMCPMHIMYVYFILFYSDFSGGGSTQNLYNITLYIHSSKLSLSKVVSPIYALCIKSKSNGRHISYN